MSSHKEEASPRGSNSCLIPGRLQMNWQMDFFFLKKTILWSGIETRNQTWKRCIYNERMIPDTLVENLKSILSNSILGYDKMLA